jgi:hypothetical protein
MISRESLAMASYSGPRAANAATFWSTTDETTAASAGDDAETATGSAPAAGGIGVGTLRVTGADGVATADDVGAGVGGGGEKRGTGGRTAAGGTAAGATGVAMEGGGSVGLGAAAGPDGGIISGRAGTAAAGAGGVARWEIGGATGAEGAGSVAGLPTTGDLTEGNPIIVRLRGGRAAPGAGVEAVGCGVMPVRATGIEADGRAPGIKDGRGAGGTAGAAAGPAATTGREPDGRVAALAAHADGAEAAGAVGPRSMVISP